MTPLMDAARGNHVQATQFLITEYEVCTSIRWILVLSSIHLLLVAGLVLMVSFFPRLQCDLSATDDLGRCSLHHSSQSGAVSTTELLVMAGVDHSSRARASQLTPLHYAAKVWAGIAPEGLSMLHLLF